MCQICRMGFNRQGHLQDHMDGVHNKKKQYECSHCDATFRYKQSAKVHEKLHTDYASDNDSGDLTCSHRGCTYSSRNEKALKQHEYVHTRIYACLGPRKGRKVCSFKHVQMTQMKRHLKGIGPCGKENCLEEMKSGSINSSIPLCCVHGKVCF